MHTADGMLSEKPHTRRPLWWFYSHEGQGQGRGKGGSGGVRGGQEHGGAGAGNPVLGKGSPPSGGSDWLKEHREDAGTMGMFWVVPTWSYPAVSVHRTER